MKDLISVAKSFKVAEPHFGPAEMREAANGIVDAILEYEKRGLILNAEGLQKLFDQSLILPIAPFSVGGSVEYMDVIPTRVAARLLKTRERRRLLGGFR